MQSSLVSVVSVAFIPLVKKESKAEKKLTVRKTGARSLSQQPTFSTQLPRHHEQQKHPPSPSHRLCRRSFLHKAEPHNLFTQTHQKYVSLRAGGVFGASTAPLGCRKEMNGRGHAPLCGTRRRKRGLCAQLFKRWAWAQRGGCYRRRSGTPGWPWS